MVARQIDDAKAARAEDAQDLELLEQTHARAEGVANRDLLHPDVSRASGVVVGQRESVSDMARTSSSSLAKRMPIRDACRFRRGGGLRRRYLPGAGGFCRLLRRLARLGAADDRQVPAQQDRSDGSR